MFKNKDIIGIGQKQVRGEYRASQYLNQLAS